MKKKLAGLVVTAIFAALLLPAFAGAQTASPSDHQYSGNLEEISTGGGGGGNITGTGGGGGTSPSTGRANTSHSTR